MKELIYGTIFIAILAVIPLIMPRNQNTVNYSTNQPEFYHSDLNNIVYYSFMR